MKRGLFGEKQNQVKIDKGGNAASCVLIPISAFDCVVNNGTVPFMFRMSRIIGLHVWKCRQVHSTTPELLETEAEVMIRVQKLQHMVQKRKREGPTTPELFL